MYQVLYRKWRPKIFDDVVGQEHVTKTLKNELKSAHIAHAYLFTGSRGTGKTSCAKILAKAVNCLSPRDGNPCGECDVCKGIEAGSVLDVTEIDAASNNGVENIREIREEAIFTPAIAKYRVYIVDEVHMLSIGAFNALLKILEEPPKHVIFILATTEVHKIPVTILSRCQRFDFHRIPLKVIADRIEYICKNENVEISSEASLLISRFADGALRDALSILDQCISKNKSIDVDTVLNVSGTSMNEDILKIVRCILNDDLRGALLVLEQLDSKSKDMCRLCEQILDCFRNIMLYKIVGQEGEILSYNVKEEIDLETHMLELKDVIEYIEVLQATYDHMQKGFNKKFEMELCLIKLCGIKLDKDNKSKVLNKENKEISVSKDKVDNDIDRKISDDKLLNYADESDDGFKKLEVWPKVIDVLIEKGNSKSMAMAFKNSNAYQKDNYILIDAPGTLAFELLREPENRNKMRNAIMEVTGKCYNLGPYKKNRENDMSVDKLDEFSNIVKDSGIKINLN